MRSFTIYFLAQITLLVVVFLSVPLIVDSIRIRPSATQIQVSLRNEGSYRGEQSNTNSKANVSKELGTELYPSGSGLPDCTHACGPCTPCKRVMVGFQCLMAESCPVVYRCMCKGKYYQVPSN